MRDGFGIAVNLCTQKVWLRCQTSRLRARVKGDSDVCEAILEAILSVFDDDFDYTRARFKEAAETMWERCLTEGECAVPMVVLYHTCDIRFPRDRRDCSRVELYVPEDERSLYV